MKEPTKMKKAGISAGQVGCTGLQREFPVLRFQEVAPAWVPFEELIVLGWE